MWKSFNAVATAATNAANEAAVALLAKRLKVAKGSISVLRGHRSRDKVVQVQGLDDPSVMARLGSTGSGRGSPE